MASINIPEYDKIKILLEFLITIHFYLPAVIYAVRILLIAEMILTSTSANIQYLLIHTFVQVSSGWYRVIADGMLWKRLIAWKVKTDPVWSGLAERRGW